MHSLGDMRVFLSGLDDGYSGKDISGTEEIARLEKRLGYRGVSMRIADKNAEATYWPGRTSVYDPGNLTMLLRPIISSSDRSVARRSMSVAG